MPLKLTVKIADPEIERLLSVLQREFPDYDMRKLSQLLHYGGNWLDQITVRAGNMVEPSTNSLCYELEPMEPVERAGSTTVEASEAVDRK